MAVAKDGTAQSGSTGNGTSAATGASVSTSGTNRILLASLTVGAGAYITGTSVSGGGLTWAKIDSQQGNDSAFQFLTTEIWWAWAAIAITNQTITASWTNLGQATISVQAWSGSKDYTGLTAGVDFATSKAHGASANSSVNITTLKAGSWVVASTCIADAVGVTANANCAHLFSESIFTNAHAFDERTDSPVSVGTYAIGSTGGVPADAYVNLAMEIIDGTATAAFNPYYYRNIAGHGG